MATAEADISEEVAAGLIVLPLLLSKGPTRRHPVSAAPAGPLE